MKKNWIYYKRFWFVSFLEIALPILMLLALVITRSLIQPQNLGSQGFEDQILVEYDALANSTVMHYPMIYFDGYTSIKIDQLLEREMNQSRFLGIDYQAFESYYPRGCFRHRIKRTLVGIAPKDEITYGIERSIYLWSNRCDE